MNTYRVTLIRQTCEYAITEVEATTEEEAQRVAIALDECEGLAWTPDLDTYGVTEVDACALIGTDDAPAMTTLRLAACAYADHDDCLSAAAADVARERGLEGWDLAARWEDDERDVILLDVPT